MSGFTRNRLQRLESRPGRPCPECGAGSSAPATYEIVFVDPHGDEEEEEFCTMCGRQTTATITWMDQETPRGEGVDPIG